MSRYHLHLVIHELSANEGLSARQIAARLNISDRTVRRHLKMGRYEPPKPRATPKKLDHYKQRIKQLLERDDYPAAKIFRIVREEGYAGSESVLRDYVAQVRPRRQTPYLTLHFQPGEAAQVDFAECGLIKVGETRRKLYAFVMTLCYSRAVFVRFILRQNMEHFLQCHRDAFEYFHGVPQKVIVDNCKVAVKRHASYGEPLINERFADCAARYGFKIVPCGVRKPQEKGRVERAIGYLRTSFLSGIDLDALSLAALNDGVRRWMEDVANVRVHGLTRETPMARLQAEQAASLPLPLFPYDCGVIVNARVNCQYRVIFEANRYSVPPEFAGKRVELGVYPERLLVRHEGKTVAEHERSYERGLDIVLAEHDRALIERRHKARNGVITRQFLALGQVADVYCQGLHQKRLNPGVHIRKIMALASVYGRDNLVLALKDAAEMGAFGSDYVANILETRQRVTPCPGPLHLSRKSDYLELELDAPNLDAYDIH